MDNQILTASVELRALLEEKRDEIVGEGYTVFEDFPTGCCECTTHLLSHFLIHRGLCKASDMKIPWNNHDQDGEFGCASHGWIRLSSGLNIDITADQFAGIHDAVIVAKDHGVHRRFTGGEWVSFEEHHRRVTWQDEGETFRRVWHVVTSNAAPQR